MLITHKATLGVKIVYKVTVMSDEPPAGGQSTGLPGSHLAFHIMDALDEEMEDPDSDLESDGVMRRRSNLHALSVSRSFLRIHMVHIWSVRWIQKNVLGYRTSSR